MSTLLKAVAIVALFFVMAFLGRLKADVDKVSDASVSALMSVQSTAIAANRAISNIDAAASDLRRTILIAGGTLNIARDTLRDERENIRKANEATVSTMQNASRVLETANATLQSIPPVMVATQRDLAALEPVIQQAQPVLKNTADTMANATRITGDLAKIADDATAPKPWYKKAFGYLWAPIKLAAIFAK